MNIEQKTTQMKFPFSYVIYLLLASIVLHFIATTTDIYQAQIENDFVWFDNILHAISGIAFGILFLWILDRKRLQYSLLTTTILTIIFVFGLAVLWEFLELGFLKFFTSYAYNLKIYSTSISEALFDIFSDIIGAIILLLFVRKWYK